MDKPKLFVSFSGGKTSAYMTYMILTFWGARYDIVVVFANTGQEHDKTLEFVRDCDLFLGFNTVWVEAVVHPGRKGTTHRVVDFETACRDGSIFEAMILKFGLPCMSYPHCTRELKLRPMEHYIKCLGWMDHETAIGMRSDELSRESKSAETNRWLYPLIYEWPTDRVDVELFWESMHFTLDLPAYKGNCVWCWKKTDSKHFLLIRENDSTYDFPASMERDNSLCGNGSDVLAGKERTFFRKHRSTEDMRKAAQIPSIEHLKRIVGDSIPAGCSGSCEPYV